MKIEQFYRDHSIDYITEGHKHAQSGWVNISCPFCGNLPGSNPGYHLGYNTHANYFHCWRCGGKHIEQVVQILLNIPHHKVNSIIDEYEGSTLTKTTKPKIGTNPFQFPPLIEFTKHHLKYLEKRKFDPSIIDEWELKATGNISILDQTDYKWRILAPIHWNGKIVSFQGRDITNKSKLKYKACPKKFEIIEHQTILYGKPDKWKTTGICVEGITDVWRFGVNSFAVFGIEYTTKQVRHIKRQFKRVAIVFDDDPQAQIQAKKLQAQLQLLGVDAFIITIKDDPGNMDQNEANYLVKQIL
jgi:hypothetical protein